MFGLGMFTAERNYNMLRRSAVFYLLVLLLQGNPAFGNDELTNILNGIQNKYGTLPGLAIDYTREVITRSMSILGNKVKGDLAEGRIFFTPPYCLRLEQKTPNPETLLADGETLWWYIPEEKRVYKYPFDEFGKELRLLSDIFRGLSEVEKNFQVTMLDRTEQEAYQIELSPDPPWQEINRIVLTVTGDFTIRVVSIHNQLGGITRFTLHGLVSKAEFPKDFFQFVLPEGVTLVEEKR